MVTACVLLVFVLVWALTPLLRRGRRPTAFKARAAVKFPTALLVCLYLFFPSLVRVAWGMFACVKLDMPGKPPYADYAVATAPYGYFVQDMRQACYQGWHLGWSLGLGVVTVLIFCVGVPVGLLLWLLTNRSRLGKPEVRMRCGFLYVVYKADRYWYEALVAARTVLLVCIAVFASVVGPYYGVVMSVVVFHVSLVLQLSLRPFAFMKVHRLQLALIGCLDLTGCVALTFFTVGLDAASDAVAVYKEVAGAVLLLVHAVFLCCCLWVILSGLPMRHVRAAWGAVCKYAGKLRRCCICTAVYCCSAKETTDCVLPDPLAGSASAGLGQKL